VRRIGGSSKRAQRKNGEKKEKRENGEEAATLEDRRGLLRRGVSSEDRGYGSGQCSDCNAEA
jgi:hypothetical protein